MISEILPKLIEDWNSETVKKLIDLEYEEDQSLEYKEFLENPNIGKTENKAYRLKIEELLASFANGKGGFILFGISDKREIKGINLKDDEELNLKISQIISNCIPSISFSTKLILYGEKKILLVKVEECLDKPVQSSNGSFHIRIGGQSLPITRDYLRDLFITKEVKKQRYDRLLFEINYFLQVIEDEHSLASHSGFPPFFKLRLVELQESLSNYYGYLSEKEQNIIKRINSELAEIKRGEKYHEITLLVQGTKKWGNSFTDMHSFLQDGGVSRDFLNSNLFLYSGFNSIKPLLIELKSKMS